MTKRLAVLASIVLHINIKKVAHACIVINVKKTVHSSIVWKVKNGVHVGMYCLMQKNGPSKY